MMFQLYHKYDAEDRKSMQYCDNNIIVYIEYTTSFCNENYII